MQISVFVNSVGKSPIGGVVVEASNGSPEGPPFVRFTVASHLAHDIHVGKRYILTVEEAE